MKKIGIDKRDPSYRHFYYDDLKILLTNPPQYEVHYVDDENDVDYIDCSYVIKIKDIFESNTNIEQDNDAVVLNGDKKEVDNVLESSDNSDKVIQIEEKKTTKKGRKKKVVKDLNKDIVEDNKEDVNSQSSTISVSISNVSYKYDVIELSFSNKEELVKMLNKFGADGWDLCSSEIYNNGLFSDKRIICIMKKVECI